MLKGIFAFVFFLRTAVGGADPFAKELVQNFETCFARLPKVVSDAGMKWVSETTMLHIKYADEIWWGRVADIYLTGLENYPVRQVRNLFYSPCLTDTSEPYVVNQTVTEHLEAESLGIKIPISSTLLPTGVVTTVLFQPNTQIPALTVTWVPTFTDAATWVVAATCLPEGHRGFLVLTTREQLDEDSVHQIHEYLSNTALKDDLGIVTTYRASRCSSKP